MLSNREKLEIFKGRLGLFDKNLKLVGPSCSKLPQKEQSDPIGTKNKEIEQNPNKICLMELATTSTNLILAYMDFNENHEQAVKYFPHNEKIWKLREDAMCICDEQRLSSQAMPENHSLSFSQDDEYWQDPAVIEAWDRFSKISANEKNVKSSVFARADCPTVTKAIDVTKIAAESVQIANSLSENEGPAMVVDSEKTEGGSSIRSRLRSSVKKGFGTPTFSLGFDSQNSDDLENSPTTVRPSVAADADVPLSGDVGPSAAGAADVPVLKKHKVQSSMLLRSPFKLSTFTLHYQKFRKVSLKLCLMMIKFVCDNHRKTSCEVHLVNNFK
ncbi:uncharacterized protein LOC130827129 isoform X2 [Amaranthus tricolor]|uniref:uncharacterized protein LOC130827129 isoform X2 n=1 Tax=Amaranthus tricolor TaxID=29722 RepID=UPI00258BADFA|nr:uncharacterized protein LOC130827129 isoform X2 [Amaranthus tricolor]